MKTRSDNTIPQSKNLVRIVAVTAIILLIPLVAMQFTDDVAWSFADFVAAGFLLLGTGLLYDLASKKVRNANYRAVIGIALVAVLALIWIELAVGIFGTPFSGS